MKLLLFITALVTFLFWSCRSTYQTKKANEMPMKSTTTLPQLPAWAKNAVLYEINVRQFSEEGNFHGVVRQLPRLKTLGVDILWLMPIFPIGEKNRKGSLGSPYSVKDYLAVNPDFGTQQELKNLITQAHQLGMKVILDWVPNHTAWDHVWTEAHPDYYTKIDGKFTVPLNEKGEQIHDWSDVCDLNYDNPQLRAAMIDAMLYWVKTCDIDGFRVDMSGLVPIAFWKEAHPRLQADKPLFMLSEWQDEKEHFNSAFQVNYGWRYKDVTKAIAEGKTNALALDTLLQELDAFYPKHYEQLYFTLNHDENSWSGTESELYSNYADAMNVLAFTWQGMPMIYNGQEAGLSQRLAFFDKEAIRWIKPERAGFFQALTQLRHQNPALATGNPLNKPVRLDTQNPAVYGFYRQMGKNTVIVLLNCSDRPQSQQIALPHNIAGQYNDHFTQKTTIVGQTFATSLEPYSFLVLTKK